MKSHDIIIVDDASLDDEVATVAARHGTRLVRLPVNAGPAAARNAGAAAGPTATLLFFVDSDVLVSPDVRARLTDIFADPSVAAAFGCYDDAPARTDLVSLYVNLRHREIHRQSAGDADTFWAGCGAVRRAAFDAVGGFDPSPRWNYIEDVEFGRRLHRAGYAIRLDPALQGKHLKRWTLANSARTDALFRARPWVSLMLEETRVMQGLNADRAGRASLMAVFAIPACLVVAIWWWPALFLAGLCLAAIPVLNLTLFRSFARIRGVGFAAACSPLACVSPRLRRSRPRPRPHATPAPWRQAKAGCRLERAMSLRIGIAGCGRIAGYFHLPILCRLPGAELVALSDVDPSRMAAAGAEHAAHARRHGTPEALIADPGVDAVVLCTPPAQHAPLAIAAFAAGKHVYVEKPLALTSQSGREVVSAWHRARTVGMVGLNFRHHPAYLDLRRRVAAGEVGAVLAVRTAFCSARRTMPHWKQAAVTGGGAVRDLGAHHLDLVPWLIGAPIQTVSMAQRSELTDADTALLTIELTSGIGAQILLSLSAATSENRIEVIGTEGAITADTAFATAWPTRRPGGRVSRAMRLGRIARSHLSPGVLLAASPPEPSFAAALAMFVEAAAKGGTVSPDIQDGQASLEAVAAAERSAQSGRCEAIESRAPAESPAA